MCLICVVRLKQLLSHMYIPLLLGCPLQITSPSLAESELHLEKLTAVIGALCQKLCELEVNGFGSYCLLSNEVNTIVHSMNEEFSGQQNEQVYADMIGLLPLTTNGYQSVSL